MADSYEEEIQKKMDALPPQVRDLIYSADMGTIIRSIGTKHQLHLDQIGALETEAAGVMIGLSEASNFVSEVASSLNVSQDKAAAIVEDVNTQLFVKIQDAMKGASRNAPSAPPLTGASRPSVTMPSAAPKPAVPAPVKINTPTAPSVPPMPPKITPPPAPATPKPAPAAPAAPKLVEMHPADMMLAQKTVTAAPAAPKPAAPIQQNAPAAAAPAANNTPAPAAPAAKKEEGVQPKPYTADPYREPVE